jgi:hypothetical protein
LPARFFFIKAKLKKGQGFFIKKSGGAKNKKKAAGKI